MGLRVTDWFQQGCTCRFTPFTPRDATAINGFKLRELFVRPHAEDHAFFYGVNFEFSVNHTYWESRRITSEVRPIVGLHLHPVDIIFNPIVDTGYTGGLGNLEFVPSKRMAYNFNDKWAVALEEYSDSGRCVNFFRCNTNSTKSGPSWITASRRVNIEAGIGVGVSPGPTSGH